MSRVLPKFHFLLGLRYKNLCSDPPGSFSSILVFHQEIQKIVNKDKLELTK